MLSTNKQINRQTNSTKNITSLCQGGNYAWSGPLGALTAAVVPRSAYRLKLFRPEKKRKALPTPPPPPLPPPPPPPQKTKNKNKQTNKQQQKKTRLGL